MPRREQYRVPEGEERVLLSVRMSRDDLNWLDEVSTQEGKSLNLKVIEILRWYREQQKEQQP